ncbi:hypothetical protein ACN94_07435 [Gordonia paraffinivorans]|uniref:GIY-YIG nuclease family protein n=1 Tax=Gordonia paraffinivorans TaxID=175628 RepID=UPI001C92BD92|nr:GIY-YIG nuclease family protein [Gordonia paraffinivorans]MBY4573413.1 hypothetical protein [Gordonia paraffinivorans]
MDAVELPVTALGEFMASSAFAEMLDADDERSASRGARGRQAEIADVVRALDTNAGRRFVDRERAGEAIIGGLRGGGFGVRPTVVDAVLDLLRPVGVAAPGAPKAVPLEVQTLLGVYVFALVDPRDASVFYVGAGRGNRVVHHSRAALAGVDPDTAEIVGAADPAAVWSATEELIRDIDADGFGVEHWILRYGDEVADSVEALMSYVERYSGDLATLARLQLTNGSDLDDAASRGVIRLDELVLQHAAPIAPPLPEPCVLVKVDDAARPDASAEQIYEWARSGWRAGPHRTVPDLPVLVFADDIVRAVHRVDFWETFRDAEGNLDPKRWVYTGAPDVELEQRYVGTSLREVRERRGGKWNPTGWHPYGQV